MREPQLLEGAIDCVVRHGEPELLMKPHDQIARPPADHAMDRCDRALLYDPGEKDLMDSLEFGGIPGKGILMRPSAPCSLNRITQSRSV